MSGPLQLGLIISTLGFIRGGLESIAAGLAGQLAERGHTVTVVTGWYPGSRLSPELAALPVRWLHVPCLPLTLPSWRRWLAHRPAWPLRAQSQSFWAGCAVSPAVNTLLGSADVTLTFLEVESVLASTRRARLDRPNVSYFPGVIDWRWLRRDRSAVRVALSHSLAARYTPPLTDIRIDGVVPPGIPARLLEGQYTVRAEARELAFAGRLEDNKGVLDLLKIYGRLSARFPHLRLTIWGDGPLRPQLEARAAQAGFSNQVRFAGAQPPEIVWRGLAKADLFVFPSRYESFGLAVLEALAIGIPVVASDLPALREAAGSTARLLPAGDLPAWDQNIASLLADPAERARMSDAGRAQAQQFTWPRAAEALERYLRQAALAIGPMRAGAGGKKRAEPL